MKKIIKQERPYEKCFEKGPEYLTDSELLSVILRCGTKGVSVDEIATTILSEFSSDSNLTGLMHCNKERLLKVKGVGKVKTVQILCLSELVKRISTYQAKEKLDFNNPKTIASYFMESMRHSEKEELVVAFLNTKCQLIDKKLMTVGTVNKSLFSVREIFREALIKDCVSVIILHNHPSGDPTPSMADDETTKALVKGGKYVGIGVLDHIIIGDKRYYSYAEHRKI